MSKLLVVDDEFGIREIIKKYASFEGYEVKEAASGMEALDMVMVEDFDLIIMDVMMPELDGFRLARKSESTRKHLLLCFRHAAKNMTVFTALNWVWTTML